ncbi:MAG TPA: DUF3048 domain-containing protein [Candidatus Dormibacteraeota bacterium]|nr:DUF3048 domain-containing protein [Candidatus Dormibacteraeota bacterium]
MRRRTPALCVVVAGLLSIVTAACGGGDTSSTSDAAAASTSSTAPTPPAPTPAPTPAPLAAPLMVQVENSPDARPQSGLGAADFVYEYETEGGISRFSAFYLSPPSVQVGPIRSAREATVKLASIYDASLVYSGAVPYIVGQLGVYHDRSIAETGGPSFRISSRAAPHNLYTDGKHLTAYDAGVHAAPASYQLWGRTPVSALPAGGTPALHASVDISNFEQPSFTWDAAAGGYTRTEPTGLLMDGATGKPWTVPTIVVMQVKVTVGPEVEDVSGAHGLDFAVAGTGPVQVMTGGWSFSGTYAQGSSGPPNFSMASGAGMPIAPGGVLLILMRQGNTVRATA